MSRARSGVSAPFWGNARNKGILTPSPPVGSEGPVSALRAERYCSEGCLVMTVTQVETSNGVNGNSVRVRLVCEGLAHEFGSDWAEIVDTVKRKRLVAIVPVPNLGQGFEIAIEGPAKAVPNKTAETCPDCGLLDLAVYPGMKCPNPVCPGVGGRWFRQRQINDDGMINEGKLFLLGLREAKTRGPEIYAAALRCFEKWREE